MDREGLGRLNIAANVIYKLLRVLFCDLKFSRYDFIRKAIIRCNIQKKALMNLKNNLKDYKKQLKKDKNILSIPKLNLNT
jgi:hypothetical protein